jgi:hypothetical protein
MEFLSPLTILEKLDWSPYSFLFGFFLEGFYELKIGLRVFFLNKNKLKIEF